MNILKKVIHIGVLRCENETEVKRVKVLNVTASIALFHAVFFLIFDSIMADDDIQKLWALSLEALFFLLVLVLQGKGLFSIARLSFIIVVLMLLFYHCNFAFKGYYGEYQYFVVPLFSLFLFDKYYIHYTLLSLSIAAFYLPNFYFEVYPEKYFGYINALLLFVGIFIIVDFFKRNSERNEKELKKQLQENLTLQRDLDEKNKELQSLNSFQNHFFVNIAHEMNTPITILKGQTNRLEKKVQESSLKAEAKKIVYQVDKLESLTTNILDIAKINSDTLVLEKTEISVNKLVQNLYLQFQPMYKEKDVRLSTDFCESIPFVLGDMLYLERVVANVLSNAYKFTSQGGEVVLKVSLENDKVVLRISDSGIGVPEEDLELIFERFYQSPNEINKASGSGIGLAFAKEVIELHEGSIVANNNKINGLSITIALDQIFVFEDKDSVEEKILDVTSILGKKILVVDDNKEMRTYLTSMLQDYHTITAENGYQALEILKNEQIDAVITDYMMPVMDGRTLVIELKKDNAQIPVIVITARADVGSKLDMLSLGVDDYLRKPFVEEELLLRLKNILINNTARIMIEENPELEAFSKKTDALSKCVALVQENISNSYYGVAQLSDDMDVSERTLYRILKKETGLSPNLFIRELKLDTVRKRVEAGTKVTLNELATSVGLTNGTYLNQLYARRFGKTIER